MVLVVVGALGSVTKKLGQWIEKLGIMVRIIIGLLQKPMLLETFQFQESVPREPLVICCNSLLWDDCRHENIQSSELNGE